MGKKPETLSSENQPLPENKEDLASIDRFLETTLSFVENIVDNPGKTQEQLRNQAWSIFKKFEELFQNNLKIFSKFRLDEKDELTGQPEESAILTEKSGNIVKENHAYYNYYNPKEGNILFEVKQLKKKMITPSDSTKMIVANPWQQVEFQKYNIEIKGNRFKSFELYKNHHNEKGAGIERIRHVKVNVTYNEIGLNELDKLEIIMESNPLKKEEFFRDKPKAVKKKGLEIEVGI